MLFAFLGTMLLAALLAIAWPLYRQEKRISAKSAGAVVVVVVLSVSLYRVIGSPGAESAAPGDLPSIDEMVSSLAARLEENPDDLRGWKMLARSYVELRDFDGAVTAYERAVEIEGGQDGQTLADLGEALLLRDGRTLQGHAGDLFENALAVSPNNPKALFYSGMAAIERGDKELGADRWEALLATSPPPNIQEVLRQQIAELRGTAPPPAAPVKAEVVTVRVSLGEAAISSVQPDNTVFIIARDPGQPAPPIAAVRRKASELPVYVGLGDSDAMIPGRVPSAFADLEIVARVSTTGQPIAQSGDWFGQQTIATADTNEVSIVIDQRVP